MPALLYYKAFAMLMLRYADVNTVLQSTGYSFGATAFAVSFIR